MNIYLIILKILATIAVIILAKDTALLPFDAVDESTLPSWRRYHNFYRSLALFTIIMIWIK